MCLRAAADWDVFSAIKAFPHVSISDLQELSAALQSCFLSRVARENFKNRIVPADPESWLFVTKFKQQDACTRA